MKTRWKHTITAIALLSASPLGSLGPEACDADRARDASRVLLVSEAKSDPEPPIHSIFSDLREGARVASLLPAVLPIVLPIVSEHLSEAVPDCSAGTALRAGRRRMELALIDAVLTSTVALGARVLGYQAEAPAGGAADLAPASDRTPGAPAASCV